MRYACATSRIASPAGHPRRRAANCAAVARFKRIRKSAPVRRTLRDVAVKRRISPKLVADASLRVEHKNGDSDVVSDGFHYGREIGVARNEDKAFGAPFVCVAKHRIRDVHVGHLLRNATNLDATVGPFPVTGRAWLLDWGEEFGLFAVTAFYDFDKWASGECGKVLALPLGMALVGGFVDYARCEILDGGNGVVGIEKFGGECLKVKPFVGGAAKLPIVEIAAVDVDDCVFHLLVLKVQEPGSRPALRRLPESRRDKRPVIGGTWYCTKFSARM